MSLTLLIVVVHVFSAIAMVAGLVARELTRMQMRKTNELAGYLTLLDMVGRFENILVRPGSMLIAVSGILLAVLEGYPLFGFLQGGQVNWLLISNLLVVSIVALIIFVFIPQGKQFDRLVAESKQKGEITPALRDEDGRPILVWAHRWENVATALILFLMIAKPI